MKPKANTILQRQRKAGRTARRQVKNSVPESAASALFHRALDMAQQQRAKAWALRIAMSLNQLGQQCGKQEESRQRLESVYSWYTEGFETADLQEARALLVQLGAQADCFHTLSLLRKAQNHWKL